MPVAHPAGDRKGGLARVPSGPLEAATHAAHRAKARSGASEPPIRPVPIIVIWRMGIDHNSHHRDTEKKEMQAHGFSVEYYGGWFVELNAPKGLTQEEHYEYLDQKAAYINSLGAKKSKAKKK